MDRKLEAAVVEALTGLEVHIEGGPFLHDTVVKPLVKQGAQDIVDRLRARGYILKEAAE